MKEMNINIVEKKSREQTESERERERETCLATATTAAHNSRDEGEDIREHSRAHSLTPLPPPPKFSIERLLALLSPA